MDITLGSGFAVFLVLSTVMNVIMALAVNGEAKRELLRGRGLFLFGPMGWGWIVLVFSIGGLALYWAIHHSSLRQRGDEEQR